MTRTGKLKTFVSLSVYLVV